MNEVLAKQNEVVAKQNQFNYNGLTHHYNDNTTFIVEIGRFQNKYKTLESFHSPSEAISFYDNYQVSDGYKKRLVMIKNDQKITLSKFITQLKDAN